MSHSVKLSEFLSFLSFYHMDIKIQSLRTFEQMIRTFALLFIYIRCYLKISHSVKLSKYLHDFSFASSELGPSIRSGLIFEALSNPHSYRLSPSHSKPSCLLCRGIFVYIKDILWVIL